MKIAVFLVLASSTLTIASTNPWTTAGFQTACFLLAICKSLLPSGNKRLRIHSTALLILAPAIVAGLQLSASSTLQPAYTTESLLHYLALAALAFSISEGLDIRAFVIFASLVAFYVLIQPYQGPLHLFGLIPASTANMAGPFQNRNTYASFIELALPASGWLAIKSKSSSFAWWTATAMMAASVVSTGARTGSVLVALEIVILLVVTARTRMAIAVAITSCVLWFALAGTGTLWTRMQFSDPLAHRREIYQSSIKLVAAKPYAGYGMGAFRGAYPAYASFDNGTEVNHAHNDMLELAVEGGAPLALLILVAAFKLCRDALQHICYVGLVFVMVHALVDYPLQRAGMAGWFVAMTATLCRTGTMYHGISGCKKARRNTVSTRRVPEP